MNYTVKGKTVGEFAEVGMVASGSPSVKIGLTLRRWNLDGSLETSSILPITKQGPLIYPEKDVGC